jgi:hypothetical protein
LRHQIVGAHEGADLEIGQLAPFGTDVVVEGLYGPRFSAGRKALEVKATLTLGAAPIVPPREQAQGLVRTPFFGAEPIFGPAPIRLELDLFRQPKWSSTSTPR